jgi:hypothetical protein
MTTRFYKRSGERVSRAYIKRQKDWFVNAKRFGTNDPLPVSKQPTVANAIERMTEEQYCDWSGSYTFKKSAAK